MKEKRLKNKMPIEFEYVDNSETEEEIEDGDEEETDEVEESDEEEVEEISESDSIEEIEFDMTEDEIDEWINELIKLKSGEQSISLQIDEDLFLKINNLDSEEEAEEEE
jgi:hypothetical protein